MRAIIIGAVAASTVILMVMASVLNVNNDTMFGLGAILASIWFIAFWGVLMEVKDDD